MCPGMIQQDSSPALLSSTHQGCALAATPGSPEFADSLAKKCPKSWTVLNGRPFLRSKETNLMLSSEMQLYHEARGSMLAHDCTCRLAA